MIYYQYTVVSLPFLMLIESYFSAQQISAEHIMVEINVARIVFGVIGHGMSLYQNILGNVCMENSSLPYTVDGLMLLL